MLKFLLAEELYDLKRTKLLSLKGETIVRDYRSISLTFISGKILEQIVKQSICKELDFSNSLLLDFFFSPPKIQVTYVPNVSIFCLPTSTSQWVVLRKVTGPKWYQSGAKAGAKSVTADWDRSRPQASTLAPAVALLPMSVAKQSGEHGKDRLGQSYAGGRELQHFAGISTGGLGRGAELASRGSCAFVLYCSIPQFMHVIPQVSQSSSHNAPHLVALDFLCLTSHDSQLNKGPPEVPLLQSLSNVVIGHFILRPHCLATKILLPIVAIM